MISININYNAPEGAHFEKENIVEIARQIRELQKVFPAARVNISAPAPTPAPSVSPAAPVTPAPVRVMPPVRQAIAPILRPSLIARPEEGAEDKARWQAFAGRGFRSTVTEKESGLPVATLVAARFALVDRHFTSLPHHMREAYTSIFPDGAEMPDISEEEEQALRASFQGVLALLTRFPEGPQDSPTAPRVNMGEGCAERGVDLF